MKGYKTVVKPREKETILVSKLSIADSYGGRYFVLSCYCKKAAKIHFFNKEETYSNETKVDSLIYSNDK